MMSIKRNKLPCWMGPEVRGRWRTAAEAKPRLPTWLSLARMRSAAKIPHCSTVDYCLSSSVKRAASERRFEMHESSTTAGCLYDEPVQQRRPGTSNDWE